MKKENKRTIVLDVKTLDEFRKKNQHLRTGHNVPASHPDMGFEIFDISRAGAMEQHFGWKIESWD